MQNRKKTILITGAGQGIGQAIAYRFATEGFNVVIASKDKPLQVQETIEGILAAGGQALACDTDVRDYGRLKELVFQAIAHFGGVDILVNNTSAPCFNDILTCNAKIMLEGTHDLLRRLAALMFALLLILALHVAQS